MIRNITLLLILVSTLCTKSFSQAPLHYHQVFDTAFAPNGWQAYRKGATNTYNWSNSSFGAYAGAGYLYHDYPVGTLGNDTTLDWYVSPSFDFAAGGMIDSLHLNVYIISQLTAMDHFGLYLLSGSPNPDSAAHVQLLADFTYMASGNNSWLDTGGIVIPPTAGMSYLAFKYRATNNWFTVGIDELYVKRNAATGIALVNPEQLILYPNPSGGIVQIKGLDRSRNSVLHIYDQSGRELETLSVRDNQPVSLHLADGIYLYKIISTGGGTASGKLMIKN